MKLLTWSSLVACLIVGAATVSFAQYGYGQGYPNGNGCNPNYQNGYGYGQPYPNGGYNNGGYNNGYGPNYPNNGYYSYGRPYPAQPPVVVVPPRVIIAPPPPPVVIAPPVVVRPYSNYNYGYGYRHQGWRGGYGGRGHRW
ncbi:hypothetical protein [Spirosoma aerolatum]|uniref:hypothetical protein n=1 Tax=Spirosoma aerolatum TaxID=1211326 RepID=UPI0009AC220D|nr:hypothetical protein [Spirosoma aerolatum]